MFVTSRAALTDAAVTVFTVALTALCEPVHRGSLANAREAIERREREWQAEQIRPLVGPVGGRADGGHVVAS